MYDRDPLDKDIIRFLLNNTNRSEYIREAVRVYFFLQKHGVPVDSPQPSQLPERGGQIKGTDSSTPKESNPEDQEFYRAMRAGVEDWL
jgi:hypothetical protein